MNSKWSGEGLCCGSFGELLQGVLPGNKKFLVNLKIKNSSRVRIKLTASEYSGEKEIEYAESYRKYSKSYKIVRNILTDLGRHDDCFLLVESDIPVGKGLSSSTADMTASVRALAMSLSIALKNDYLACMLTEIEPNDGVHYPGTAAYQHTTGELIARYDFVPAFNILGIDFGGTIDTVAFNRTPFNISSAEMEHYQGLLDRMKQCLAEKNTAGIARIATESAMLWQKVKPKQHFEAILRLSNETDALGVVNTHSGTFLGILYDESRKDLDNVFVAIRKILPQHDTHLFQTESCQQAISPRPLSVSRSQ